MKSPVDHFKRIFHYASMTTRRQLLRLAIAIVAANSGSALAQLPQNITPGEMALLPEYCLDVQATTGYSDRTGGNPSPRAPKWIRMMGDSFWDMHHYCWALIRIHRSKQFGLIEPVRVGMIRAAIADYVYVLEKEKAGFPLKPEIYLRIGEAYAMLPSPGEALEAFERSRREKPDYWPSYTRAADTLLTINRRKEAIALMEEGLARMPAEPNISRKLEEIRRGAEGTKGQGKTKSQTATQRASGSADVPKPENRPKDQPASLAKVPSQ